MVQWVTALATDLVNLSLVPGTHERMNSQNLRSQISKEISRKGILLCLPGGLPPLWLVVQT